LNFFSFFHFQIGGWRHGNELGLRCHLCNRILFSQFVTTLHDSLLILNEKLVNSQNMCLLVEVEKDEEIDGYKRKIEKLQEQMKVREYDNFILAQKLIKEVELRSQLMVENDLINQELNLLTEQLFNEANSMVSNEARKRSEAEALRQQAMSKLEETKNQLMYEQLQLAELREKIEKYAAEEEDESHLYDSGSSISSPVFSTSTENSNSNHLTEPIPDDKKFTRRLSTPQLVFDARLYVEFEDFIQDLKKPNSKLNSLYFMKRCIEEDIEPCLKYVGRINFKRFLDAFSENRCYVELIPKKDKNLYDSQVCCACDYKRLCTYQYKLKEEDSWKPIDRFCRDRMVAIADFYSLIRNIKLGLMRAVPLHDLYHEFSRLRRQIFYARIGSLHLFPATTKYFSGVLTNPNFGNEELITLKRSFDEDGEFKNSREFQIFENEESRRLSQISSLKNLFSAEFEAGSSGSEEDARRSNQITFPPKEPPQDKEDNYRNSISSAMKAFRSKQNSMIFKKSPKDLTAFEKSLQPGQSSSSLKDLKD